MPYLLVNPLVRKVGRKVLRTAKMIFRPITITSPYYEPLVAFKNDRRLAAIGASKTCIRELRNHAASGTPVADVYRRMANFILNIGHPEIAQDYYKRSLEISLNPTTFSMYLQCLLLSPTCTDADMHEAASAYNKSFFNDVKKFTTYQNMLLPFKRLRVGYVCHFFHNSVSKSLLLPFLKAHNRTRVEVFCYSDTTPGEVDSEVQSVSDAWRDTKNLNDIELATLIRNDRIDILLELNGHNLLNRYNVMAMKPSPVQISYYNHCATTGVSSIDYNLIGDEMIIDNEKAYTESVYFMKGVCGIAIFPDSFPDCAPAPFLKNGYITFGSFGAAHKVNHNVVRVWCQILKRIPTARLYMKAGVFTHKEYLEPYKKLFESEGIDLKRIDFEGHSEHQEMLRRYSKMDIALDSFPYAAGTTTMEAIWMGVPVISLTGKTYSAQNGYGILSCINHPELIAHSVDEYINIACELAADHERLVCYREGLRKAFQNSPRADANAFAAKLEDAYVDMWQRYCKKQSAEATLIQ